MKHIITLIITFLFFSANPFQLAAQENFSPCDIVTVDIINSVFHLEKVAIENKPSGSSYPTCIYEWDGNNVTIRSVAGQKIESHIKSNVTLVIVSENISYKSYETSLKAYSGSYEKVDLYKNAVWSSKMKQLTVYIDNKLFHVHVDVDSDIEQNKTNAIELSKIIIERL